MQNRLLGIDYGDVRIGIAIADPLGITAQPFGTIKNSKTAINDIIKIIEDKKITKLVVGLPKNQYGNDSEKAREVRLFVSKLHAQYKIETEFVDERFSTIAAKRQLIEMNVQRKNRKRIIDTQAAMFILQGVLDRS